MDRQRLNTWILVGVVVVLGLAALAEQSRVRMLAPRPLLGTNAREIREIVLECPGCATRRFARRQGSWEMVSPHTLPADPDAIARLLQLPTAPSAHRYDRTHFEPARIGLDKPLGIATLGPYRFEFGTTDAINNQRYVGVGSTVALIDDRYSILLLSPAEALLDRRPFAHLRGISGVVQGDVAWPPERAAALGKLVADAVVSAPAPAGAVPLVIEYNRGRQATWALERDGERWLLRPPGASVAYAFGKDAFR